MALPRRDPGAPPANLASTFPRAAAALDAAVRDLIASGWDEPRRRHALELAATLAEGASLAGWRETAVVLRALASLLALPLGEVLPLRGPLREKLLELLDLLDDDRAAGLGG
jgi:hypothetical protein